MSHRMKKKIESDINELEMALDHANKANAEASKQVRSTWNASMTEEHFRSEVVWNSTRNFQTNQTEMRVLFDVGFSSCHKCRVNLTKFLTLCLDQETGRQSPWGRHRRRGGGKGQGWDWGSVRNRWQERWSLDYLHLYDEKTSQKDKKEIHSVGGVEIASGITGNVKLIIHQGDSAFALKITKTKNNWWESMTSIFF